MSTAVPPIALRTGDEILGDKEVPFIETAVRQHRRLARERLRFLVDFDSVERGLEHWQLHCLHIVALRIAEVEHCSVAEVTPEIAAEVDAQGDPITFLEQLVITVRTDLQHQVLYDVA
jgi:hypothetical protein